MRHGFPLGQGVSSGRLLRGAVAALLAVSVWGLGAEPAWADDTASLTGITVSQNVISGVLTVRSGQQTAVVAPPSLRLSVAGKEFPVTTQPVAAQPRTTMLVVDTSGSMGAAGMAAVRAAVAAFLQSVPSDVSVGLVSFAGSAVVDVPPTKDRAAVQAAVDQLKSSGGTTLFDGVALAVKALGATGDRSIVLLSDGADTSSAQSKAQVVDVLRSAGVRAEAIGFKTGYSDNAVLSELAAAGQGSVAAADNAAAVSAAFQAAAKALDSQVRWTSTVDTTITGTQGITLTGTANGVPFAAGTTVDVTPSPGSTATPTASPKSAAPTAPGTTVTDQAPRGPATAAVPRTVLGLPLPVLGAAVALFVGILALVLLAFLSSPSSRRRERVKAIEHYVTGARQHSASAARRTSVTGLAEQLVALGDKAVQGRESTSKTMTLLTRADLPWRAGEWAVLRGIAVVVGAFLGFLLHGGIPALVTAAVGLLVGLLLPPALLKVLAGRRAKKFESQLPDVLTLVASSLSTGFSLLQALDAVSRDVDQPSAKEFARVMAETRIGSDVEDALERMAERMDSNNMRWTSMAIGIQRQVGGNLAETLRTTAGTLRERESLFRHVRALSAEGRLSAYILIGLPIAIFLWMLKTSPDYISLLWSNIVGWAMIAGMVVMMAFGIWWMRKVVEVQV